MNVTPAIEIRVTDPESIWYGWSGRVANVEPDGRLKTRLYGIGISNTGSGYVYFDLSQVTGVRVTRTDEPLN
jgi:hypothetical protein